MFLILFFLFFTISPSPRRVAPSLPSTDETSLFNPSQSLPLLLFYLLATKRVTQPLSRARARVYVLYLSFVPFLVVDLQKKDNPRNRRETMRFSRHPTKLSPSRFVSFTLIFRLSCILFCSVPFSPTQVLFLAPLGLPP